MPLYEYRCKKCGHVFEKLQKFSDAARGECPKCGARGERQISASAIRFKGSGWYVTDYAAKGRSRDKDEKPSASDEKPSGSEEKPSASEERSSASEEKSPTRAGKSSGSSGPDKGRSRKKG